MSQSENSSDNTATQAPISFLDMQSIHQEEDDTEEETMIGGTLPLTTVVCKEDIEVMIKCATTVLDNNNEILQFLLEINRMCGLCKP